MEVSGTTRSTPPRLMASLGMPNTTQLSSSCAQRGAQLTLGKRLEDVAKGLGQLGPLQNLIGRKSSQKDHRHVETVANGASRCDAIHRAAKLYVHQHQAGALTLNQLHRMLSTGCNTHGLIAQGLNLRGNVAGDDGLILHHQNPGSCGGRHHVCWLSVVCAASNRWYRFFPDCLAAYMAWSAWRTSRSASTPSCG